MNEKNVLKIFSTIIMFSLSYKTSLKPDNEDWGCGVLNALVTPSPCYIGRDFRPIGVCAATTYYK